MKLLVNFCGGPGSGKSALAAGVFARLKWSGVSCELVTEFAKDKVWEESIKLLDDQMYVFGEQLHRVNRLRGKVDVVLTDSPLINSIIYYAGDHRDSFFSLVREIEQTFKTLDVIVLRHGGAYEQAGRYQTEDEAAAIDKRACEEIAALGRTPLKMKSCEESALALCNTITSELKQR